LEYFISPLRHSDMSSSTPTPIVILHPTPPPSTLWKRIAHLTPIFYVQGSPHNLEDLLCAGLEDAVKIVLLKSSENDQEEEEHFLEDRQTILSYLAIRTHNARVFTIIELSHLRNMLLLQGSLQNRVDMIEMNPFYAAGAVYPDYSLDSLLCRTYFNPHILNLLNRLVGGNNIENSNIESKGNGIDTSKQLISQIKEGVGMSNSSKIIQVDIPMECIGDTYENLFSKFSDGGAICLGLYRAIDPHARYMFGRINIYDSASSSKTRASLGNELPYVFTNPPPSTIVLANDRAFVLTHQDPNHVIP